MDRTSKVYKAAVAAETEIAERSRTAGWLSLTVEDRNEIREGHRPSGISMEVWREALREADIEVERKVRY